MRQIWVQTSTIFGCEIPSKVFKLAKSQFFSLVPQVMQTFLSIVEDPGGFAVELMKLHLQDCSLPGLFKALYLYYYSFS